MSISDRRALIADAAIGTVATHGLRGLTHRAVDAAAGLAVGSTSYYFRTRAALIGACYRRLSELDLADIRRHGPRDLSGLTLDTAAEALASLLHHWLTEGRERQLARFELTLEAARRPELRAELHAAGLAAREQVTAMLTAFGVPHARAAGHLLTACVEGILYDRLAGALAEIGPRPDMEELTWVSRRMLQAVLDDLP
ncbi:TetR/AcrR family transcriptional regulator [Sinosporangium siamense]|uniref:TetR family transcriptional regulator n=1 Tax=Sinosporangium siamense TaxID=1367973 RepID=A0A919RLK6_9ACTN|nr:TetR/AcrR family transcriptional regulator [Sinosporangium siamense]GII96013.1 TetR family transcriptional regulator [Sinosporangium siamense]